MKILCKLKPIDNTCFCCVADQLDGITPEKDCHVCLDRTPDYEILQFGHSLFFGDWAMVLDSEGHVEKVKLRRVKRVRTVSEGYMPDVLRNLDKLIFSLDRQLEKTKFF